MKKKILIVLGGLLALVLVFGAINVTSAYAQDGTPPAPFAGEDGHGRGHGGGRGLGEPELAAAAEVLNMTTDELSAALKSGKTLEELATTAGVDIQDVKDAINAVHETEMRARIETGVADGTLSQEKADWLLEGLDKGFLDGPGFGFGGPRGDRPDVQPAQTATP